MERSIPRKAITAAELEALCDELVFAWKRAPDKAVRGWCVDVGLTFGSAAVRRARNVGGLAARLVSSVVEEASGMTAAIARGRGIEHARSRGESAVKAAEAGRRGLVDAASRMRAAFESDPSAFAKTLLVQVVAGIVVSGGVDGDGGVPDLDIAMFGIEGHRSFLTHSFLTGAALETAFVSLGRLVKLLHEHLPDEHHRWWDVMNDGSAWILDAAQRGASVGLAYHLAVDSLVEPAAYKDFPVSMPLEGHQAVQGGSAIGEVARDGRPKASR